MALKKYKPYTSTRRYTVDLDYKELLSGDEPEESLTEPLHRRAGRDNQGHITTSKRRNANKRKYRLIDFKRQPDGREAEVLSIQYDPNRSAFIALIEFGDGERRYILAPQGVEEGDTVVSDEEAPIRSGNSLPLSRIPDGTLIHNIELRPGAGGAIARSAGTHGIVLGKELEKNRVVVQLPSDEVRYIPSNCMATVGRVGNVDNINRELGKAGKAFHQGKRPHVRGRAMNPVDHPHGGGEGHSTAGKPPQSATGVYAKGKRTRSRKKSLKHLVRDRRSKKR